MFLRFLLFAFCFLFSTSFVFSQNRDEELMVHIYNIENHHFDRTMRFAEKTSVPFFVGIPLITGGIALAKPSYRQDAYLLIASEFASGIVMQGLKEAFKRKRPYQTINNVQYEHGENPAPSSDSPSFPSGHATVAFSLATSLTLQSKKWYVALPAYGYASAVALSRVYDAKHYPSDILVGAILGTGITLLVHKHGDKITPNFLKNQNKNALQIAPQGIGFRITKRF